MRRSDQIRAIVLRRLFGLGDLEPLLADPDVENVYLNGFDSVWVESRSKGMQRMASPVAESDEELIILIQRLAARESIQERRWDTAQPILDLTLRDGSRLHAVREVVRRPTVTIRLHRLLKLTLDDLVQTPGDRPARGGAAPRRHRRPPDGGDLRGDRRR